MIPSLDVAAPLIASGLLSLLGVAICLSGVRSYWIQYRAVSRAEQASGTIETVDIQPVVDSGGTTYIPALEYEYQTPTQRHHGETVYPGGSRYTKLFHSESAAEAAIEAYDSGAPITVYYDPANPDHSFLEPSPHRGPNIARIVFGLGLIGLGAVLLWISGFI